MKKLNCENLKRVEDITNQCEYEDEYPQGKGDNELVSCCQDNGYNELNYKLKNYKGEFPGIEEEILLKSMCKCCNELSPKERTHEDFDKCVRIKGIIYKYIKKINPR